MEDCIPSSLAKTSRKRKGWDNSETLYQYYSGGMCKFPFFLLYGYGHSFVESKWTNLSYLVRAWKSLKHFFMCMNKVVEWSKHMEISMLEWGLFSSTRLRCHTLGFKYFSESLIPLICNLCRDGVAKLLLITMNAV